MHEAMKTFTTIGEFMAVMYCKGREFVAAVAEKRRNAGGGPSKKSGEYRVALIEDNQIIAHSQPFKFSGTSSLLRSRAHAKASRRKKRGHEASDEASSAHKVCYFYRAKLYLH